MKTTIKGFLVILTIALAIALSSCATKKSMYKEPLKQGDPCFIPVFVYTF